MSAARSKRHAAIFGMENELRVRGRSRGRLRKIPNVYEAATRMLGFGIRGYRRSNCCSDARRVAVAAAFTVINSGLSLGG